jgi:hypothetical protein
VTEVDKLWDRLQEQGVKHMHVTLTEGFTGTAEDVARELNRVDEEMRDPRNNLLARMGGQCFLLEDRIACTEGRVNIKTMQPVELSKDERYELRKNKEMLALLEEAMAMIKADGGQS